MSEKRSTEDRTQNLPRRQKRSRFGLKKYRECSFNQVLYSLVDRIEYMHQSRTPTIPAVDIYFSFLPECPTAVTDGSGAAETDEEKQKGDEKIDQWLRQKRREDLVTATGSEDAAKTLVEESQKKRLEQGRKYQADIKKRMEEMIGFSEETIAKRRAWEHRRRKRKGKGRGSERESGD